MWKNKAIRYSILTALYYLVLFFTFGVFDHPSMVGPCDIGGGIAFLLFAPFLVLPLFLLSLIRMAMGRAHHTAATVVHFVCLISYVMIAFR
ncbi:MAG TPA: hypothetical protein VGR89_05830 [Puia sp.]|nr:hypothetical protein [Puia sp.]